MEKQIWMHSVSSLQSPSGLKAKINSIFHKPRIKMFPQLSGEQIWHTLCFRLGKCCSVYLFHSSCTASKNSCNYLQELLNPFTGKYTSLPAHLADTAFMIFSLGSIEIPHKWNNGIGHGFPLFTSSLIQSGRQAVRQAVSSQYTNKHHL